MVLICSADFITGKHVISLHGFEKFKVNAISSMLISDFKLLFKKSSIISAVFPPLHPYLLVIVM